MQTACSQNTGPTCDGGPTCERGPNQTPNGLMSSAEGSRASRFRLRDEGKVKQIPAGCGRSSGACSIVFGPESESSRTCRVCLQTDLPTCSVILPRSGTMRNGVCFPRAPWVPHTHEKDCSLWSTPKATDGERGPRKAKNRGGGSRDLSTDCGRRPPPKLSEVLIGFPPGWTDLDASATPCVLPCPSGSGDGS